MITVPIEYSQSLKNAWEVLALFLIPIGGGIPAGVLLAQNRSLQWPEMTLLYLISDIILACILEPVTHLVRHWGRRSAGLGRFNQMLKKSIDLSIARYGINPSPLTLIMISFGIDPMTGRAATLAAGHGFVTGWSLAIAGDMIFFALIMTSTLWLHDLLGDGTWTAIAIMVIMTAGPAALRRLRVRIGSE